MDSVGCQQDVTTPLLEPFSPAMMDNAEVSLEQDISGCATDDQTKVGDGDGGSLQDEEELHHETAKLRLPISLLLLYAIYGLTMSLPSLPLMYIYNTRVAMPLSILPTYGALSFMPYSFKPLYAYGASFFPRQISLKCGWACCALTTMCWTRVASVPWVFIVGVSNGIFMAWSGFLLGLTLLDNARALPRSMTSATDKTFEGAASIFQSQAATARNMGSFLASILVCVVFGMNHSAGSETDWSDDLVNSMFVVTASFHFISIIIVYHSRDKFELLATQTANSSNISIPDEPRTLNSRQSYSALEIASGIDSDGSDNEDTNSLDYETEESRNSSGLTSRCNVNFIIVACLQLMVIFMAVKGPLLSKISEHAQLFNWITVAALFLLSLVLIQLVCCKGGTRLYQSTRRIWTTSHTMGIVLILRHSVPSSWAILSAYFYHCFQSQPVWLQVFSLVDNGVITLASWSYQKLFALKYSHGRKLVMLMTLTMVVAYSSNNLFQLVLNYSEDDPALSSFPLRVMIVKGFATFLSEWYFLPSMVLATVSVPRETKKGGNDGDTDRSEVEPTIFPESPEGDMQQDSSSTTAALSPTCSATDVVYGSLVSCIDLGDQIGALLSTPLVTALGISRENEWHNLDRMIEICSGLGICMAGFLAVLLLRIQPHGSTDVRYSQLAASY